ncbi:hypothetical protein E2562_006597 [Oryza meyeriana var. granulata]|uniref:Uncharacterized protein n=1 Tax=Oryza meyeriana var. granulata TaxID=110450 RepID=A0A6G1EFP3_9ORYZ|nr:hypothetical protein E2562_006597 [Oryza meyeriana var. granulata]
MLVNVRNRVELYPNATPCLSHANLAFHIGQQEGDRLRPLLERQKREGVLSTLGLFLQGHH